MASGARNQIPQCGSNRTLAGVQKLKTRTNRVESNPEAIHHQQQQEEANSRGDAFAEREEKKPRLTRAILQEDPVCVFTIMIAYHRRA